jgi:transposase-like protein
MPEQKRSYAMFGKQRRLSPELKAEIMQRLKNGERPYDVERRYRLCFNTVAKLRRLIGDPPAPLGSGRKRKLTAHVLAQAEQRLRSGDKWLDVAASCGVSPTTLAAHTQFRKRANR